MQFLSTGSFRAFTNFVNGNFACSGSAQVTVNGGSLFVTNGAATAVLEIRSGTLTLSAGTIAADKLVITNACARFIQTGGTLMTNVVVLTPGLDADGDGMPNSFEQANGFDPLNPADANTDADGDGLSNLQEFLAGTSPTNNASAFRVTAIAREANNVRVTWMTGVGRTNALQRTAGAAGSFATNNFAAIFTVTNTVGTTTNFLDVGAATNFPARYYRVRLVP